MPCAVVDRQAEQAVPLGDVGKALGRRQGDRARGQARLGLDIACPEDFAQRDGGETAIGGFGVGRAVVRMRRTAQRHATLFVPRHA